MLNGFESSSILFFSRAKPFPPSLVPRPPCPLYRPLSGSCSEETVHDHCRFAQPSQSNWKENLDNNGSSLTFKPENIGYRGYEFTHRHACKPQDLDVQGPGLTRRHTCISKDFDGHSGSGLIRRQSYKSDGRDRGFDGPDDTG